jgi:hypothetical protein
VLYFALKSLRSWSNFGLTCGLIPRERPNFGLIAGMYWATSLRLSSFTTAMVICRSVRRIPASSV